MIFEHSAGAVIFRPEADKLYFLLLHYEEGHWGAPKGHIEKNESIEDTARREIREETGLTDIDFIPGFEEKIQYYFFSKEGKVFKTVTFLLVKTRTRDIQISFEHTGFEWLLYPEALTRTTYKDEKKVLERVGIFLSVKG
jgi:bis(5'-nucleosidyl)-tetraphosphatase